MLSHNPRSIAKEATVARRALELFLTHHNLAWNDAYPLAAYERTAPPTLFQSALKRIQQGVPFDRATGQDAGGDPISADIADRAWHLLPQVLE